MDKYNLIKYRECSRINALTLSAEVYDLDLSYMKSL